MKHPRVFLQNVAVFTALVLIGTFAVRLALAEDPGHRDFPDLPFLSEAAVDDDPSGTTQILFMMAVGVDDTELIPDFKIRILDAWAMIDVTDEISYQVTDGTFGNNITSFNTTNVGRQSMTALGSEYAEIDPDSNESIYVDALPVGTTAVGHIYIVAIRVL